MEAARIESLQGIKGYPLEPNTYSSSKGLYISSRHKSSMKKSLVFEVLFLTILFLFSVYMWSLPIKNNPLPYGEVDSAHHFGIADYITEKDMIGEFYKPAFLYFLYSQRSILGGGKISTESPYPPNFFINEAIAQIIGGDRVASYYLFLAILCTSVILSSYFFIRKLFGVIPAFLSTLLIMASKIDILTFIMGQYVILVSFACLPLILYCYYKYINSFLTRKPKPIYLYIMAFFLATQYFNHFWSLVDTAVTLLIFTIFLIIKEKKFPFSIKHATIALVIFFVVLGPFIHKSVMSLQVEMFSGTAATDISDNWLGLFKWYTSGYAKIAVGQEIFSYKEMHGQWTLPLLIIGVLFLLLRRKREDLLLLSWLLALYIILHFDIFLGWGASRLFRSVNDVPYIFYPLTAIGFMGVLALIKVQFRIKKYIKYAFIAIFLVLFVNFNLKLSFEMLDKAYQYPLRINPSQYQAALWMKENIDENSIVYPQGTLIPKTKRFIRVVSHITNLEYDDDLELLRSLHPDLNISITHYFVDYSELIMFGMKKEMEALQQWEKTNFANISPIYDKNNIRIYDVRNK